MKCAVLYCCLVLCIQVGLKTGMGSEEIRCEDMEEIETRVQTGGLVVVPVRLWSSQPSVQLTGKARKGVILWGMRYG